MSAPDRMDPPYVPIRRTGWATQRTPRSLLAAGVLFVLAAVGVGIAVHPTRSQRAADMNEFLHTMTMDIQSCAGGVAESLQAMRAIEAGTSHDLKTATHIATYGATNCSPANNELLADLVQYQVHESLARFNLNRAVNGLVTWAFPDAQRVQSDIAVILNSQGEARAAASAKLHRDLVVLDNQRAYVDGIMKTAITATSATGKLPSLPG
jgi:hypothetical protein